MPIILVQAKLWKPSEYYGLDEYIRYVAWFLEHNIWRMAVTEEGAETDVERHFVIFGQNLKKTSHDLMSSTSCFVDLAGFSVMNNDMRCIQQLVNINQNM